MCVWLHGHESEYFALRGKNRDFLLLPAQKGSIPKVTTQIPYPACKHTTHQNSSTLDEQSDNKGKNRDFYPSVQNFGEKEFFKTQTKST